MVWLEVIGWAGSALLVVSLLQTRLMRLRVLNSIASAILFGYNAALGVWPMVAMNAVLVGINVWAIVRMQGQRHDSRVYDAVEMSTREPMLERLIARHAEDIERLNPHLPVRAQALVERADHAFVVTTEDQFVGLVLSVNGELPHVQHVLVDYVLAPYRDFTPGEFVFRPDGPFAAMGTRTVIASPGMVSSDAYLRAVGFVDRDGQRVLEIRDA